MNLRERVTDIRNTSWEFRVIALDVDEADAIADVLEAAQGVCSGCVWERVMQDRACTCCSRAGLHSAMQHPAIRALLGGEK